MQVYEAHGVRFEYPDDWKISIDEDNDQTAVTVEGPGTAFWTLSIISERPPAEEIIESALQCFEEEYTNVDVYEVDERICLLPTIARDLEVISLDLVSKVSLRVCETDDFSIFTMLQFADAEADTAEKALKAINASLTWETDEETPTGDPFDFDNLFGGQE